MPLLKRFCEIAAFLFATIAVPILQAEDSPEKMLEETIHEVVDILHTDENVIPLEEKRNKILNLLESRFSFDIIIRRALGRNWNLLNEKQQGDITNLISDLLIRAYTRELKNGPKPEINFIRSEDLGANKVEIVSTISYKSKLVTVSYRLANIKNRGWQVYDVLIEGVSMVSNYRKQFDEHFQTKDAEELITLLEGKLEE